MKNTTLQQEIILVTTASCLQQQLCETNNARNKHHRFQEDQLEEACWNGMLEELLPEIMEPSAPDRKLFLWHIRQKKSLLQIELSEFPVFTEKAFSIDPCSFLSTVSYN